MTTYRKPGRSQTGYGDLDRALNRALRASRPKEAADRIARDHGFEDARDARKWLVQRSPRGRESR